MLVKENRQKRKRTVDADLKRQTRAHPPAVQIGEAPKGETVERLLGKARPQHVPVDAGLRLERVDAIGKLGRPRR